MFFLAKASYIQVKAKFAQWLIASAYVQSSAHDKNKGNSVEFIKPWPWADMHVLAKLSWGEQTQYVLSHASLRSLAFGPAHMSQTSLPGEHGNSVIVGHRDTHFEDLHSLKIGQTVHVETPTKQVNYQVTEIMVVDESQVSILEEIDENALTLITCYPFGGIDPNPKLRYVVRAIEKAS